MDIGRFAPTTSGSAHPGTLLAGLLAWLDARSRGGQFVLRWEDIDPTARDLVKQKGLQDDWRWFGLDCDQEVIQSQQRLQHEQALERLAQTGRLYECVCSRSDIRRHGIPSAAGGWVYPGTCRSRTPTDWRRSTAGLRVNFEGLHPSVQDESGLDLSQDLEGEMGDPLVRRPDGGVTYQLAVVVDDEFSGVTRVVRGRDLRSNTATQVALRQLLGLTIPVFRHHFLFLEPQGSKLAKLHQSIGADTLRQRYSAHQMCGFLAWTAGLLPEPRAVSPFDLLNDFSWDRIQKDDIPLIWDGERLSVNRPNQ